MKKERVMIVEGLLEVMACVTLSALYEKFIEIQLFVSG